MPHMTLCYSTGKQPAAPVIAELGKTLPTLNVTIRELSLVVQDGPEDLWNWRSPDRSVARRMIRTTRRHPSLRCAHPHRAPTGHGSAYRQTH